MKSKQHTFAKTGFGGNGGLSALPEPAHASGDSGGKPSSTGFCGAGTSEADLATGLFLRVDRLFCRMTGYAEEELVQKMTFSQLIHPEDRGEELEALERLRLGESNGWSAEERILRKDGQVVWVHTTAMLCPGERDRPSRSIWVIEDVARRKLAEEALRESGEGYQVFVRNSPDAIGRFELEEPVPIDRIDEEQIQQFYEHAYLADCNGAMARLYGHEIPANMIGLRLPEIWPHTEGRNREALKEFIHQSYRLTDAEMVERDKDGRLRNIASHLIGIVADDRLRRVWVTSREIISGTNDDRIQQNVSMQNWIDNLPGILFVLDQRGRFMRWNENLQRVTGYTAQEVPRLRFIEFFAEDERPVITKKTREVFNEGEAAFEANLLTRDGRSRRYSFRGRRVLLDGDLCLAGIGIDIGPSRGLEEDLAQPAK